MNALLIIPNRTKFPVLPAPDIGVAYIARILIDSKFEVTICDAHKNNISIKDFEEIISKTHYDLIGIKCLTMDYPLVLQYANLIKKHHKDTCVILGGPHPSAMPQHVLQDSISTDLVVIGDGELPISELAKALKSNSKLNHELLKNIPSIAYRYNNNIIINSSKFIDDLDSIPFPAWELFNIASYPILPGGGGRFLPILTTRGCYAGCSFCACELIHGKTIRKRSLTNIINEIKWLENNFNINKVSIYDDNFSYHKDHALSILSSFSSLKSKLKLDVPQGIRLDSIDRDLILKLQEVGCDYLGVGIESGDESVLKNINKGTNLALIKNKFNLIKSTSKIKVIGFFILGFPFETSKQIFKTIKFALSLPLDYAAFTIFTPFPGSKLFTQMIVDNTLSLKNMKWDNFILDKVVFEHEFLSKSKLKNLQILAYFLFYFRPSKLPFLLRIIFKDFSIFSYLTRLKSILSR